MTITVNQMTTFNASNNVLYATKRWFEAAVPSPTNLNQHTQFGVHLEEVGEQVELLHSEDHTTQHLLRKAEIAIKELSDHVKGKENLLLLQESKQHLYLDALCDQIVTAVGCGHMAGMDILGAQAEVNRSNWSKFVDGKPIFDDQGKIQKGYQYSVADVRRFTRSGSQLSVFA